MVHSSHAAQYGLDTPTHPRALADQTYAINPKDHCVFVIASGACRRPARRDAANSCTQLVTAGSHVAMRQTCSSSPLRFLPKTLWCEETQDSRWLWDVGIRFG